MEPIIEKDEIISEDLIKKMNDLKMERTIEKEEIISDELNTEKKLPISLGDRMKGYEVDSEILIGKILPYESFIIILNIRFFKPFDLIFIKSMALTTMDLIKKFEVQTGYTSSNKINLIFNKRCNKKEYEELCKIGEKNNIPNHFFDGRIQKIITVISSYCSIRFNYYLNKLTNGSPPIYDDSIIEIINSYQQIFDANIIKFSEENIHEILNYQIRDPVQDFCRTNEIYCKKILIEKNIGEKIVMKSEYIFKQFKIIFSPDNLEMLLNKYWLNMDNELFLHKLIMEKEDIVSEELIKSSEDLKDIISEELIKISEKSNNKKIIFRLDGKTFSKFTKRFLKPFDLIFVKTMALTTLDLIKYFDGETGYTHSDEITLIFNNLLEENIQKILTLISSYCSVRFNYHLVKLINETDSIYDDNFIELINSYEQIFDARIIMFSEENIHEILNHQIWRSVHDCCRNAISTYAYTHFGSKKIMNKNCSQMIAMLAEIGINWEDDIPIFIKHGLYCKRFLIGTESEYIFKEFKINFSVENLEMLLNKYWTNTDNSILLNELSLI